MTIQERKVMKLALEALEDIANEIYGSWTNGEKAQRIAQNLIPTIKEALAQPEQEPNVDCNAHQEFLRGYAAAAEYFPPQPKEPEQEPVALVTGVYGGRFIVEPTNSAMVLPVNMALYAHPPQRTWVGLTDEERKDIELGIEVFDMSVEDILKEAEANLKEKNT